MTKWLFRALPVVLIFLLLVPSFALGATGTSSDTTKNLTTIAFISEKETNWIVGENDTVHFLLYDSTHSPFSGSVTGYLYNTSTGSRINVVPSGSGEYTVSAMIDEPGTYGLFITDINGNTVRAYPDIIVRNAMVTTNGNLIEGINSTVTGRLTDSDGNVLDRRSVTVDATNVGGNSQNYTTQSDGTFVFSITPTQAGTVNIIFAGHVVGSLQVSDIQVNVTTDGKLLKNYENRVNVKLTDNDGNPIKGKQVTVDATSVGATSQSYTTLDDGTFTFTVTPTSLGSVNIIYAGKVIDTMDVQAGYSNSIRIGDYTSDNSIRSVEVSQKGWTKANYVILTRDDVVADAMVAVPLSKKYDAPILMTPTGSLNAAVLNEIKRLQAHDVFIIGGEGAVALSVEQTLKNNGLNITRLGGLDRYGTAVQIANLVGSPGTVYLAYGYGEPDALAASALAAEQGIPILLTDTNTLPDSTKSELAALAPHSIKLLGGTGVISSGLEQSLKGQYNVERWGGIDRYVTEQIIFQNYFGSQAVTNNHPVYFTSALVSPADVASGTPYGDALIAAALAAKNNGFVVTLPPDYVPTAISTFLLYNKAYIPSSMVIGNEAAVSYAVEQQLNTLLAR